MSEKEKYKSVSISEKEKYNSVFKNSCSKSNDMVLMQNRCKINFNFAKKKIIPSGLKQSSASINYFITIHNPYKKNKKNNIKKFPLFTTCTANI